VNTPFVELNGYVWHDYKKRHGVKEMADVSTGEILEFTRVSVAQYVSDDAKFVKLFVDDMVNFDRYSNAAQSLLKWLIMNLPVGSEEVRIHVDSVKHEMGYKSRKQVYSAIYELCTDNVLAKKVGGDDYFVNPNKLFNGNRDKLLKKDIRSGFRDKLYDNRPDYLKKT
jgi:hypothetical protein